MRTSTAIAFTLALAPLSALAAEKSPSGIGAAVSSARAIGNALPRPVWRYPEAKHEIWCGWNVAGKEGQRLPLTEILAQNVFWGYRDVFRPDPKDPTGKKLKYVGRQGGALHAVERGMANLGKAVHDSPVFPKLYDALGL